MPLQVVVVNGVPYWDNDRQAYKMTDNHGTVYWLDGQAFQENHDELKSTYMAENPKLEISEAEIKADEEIWGMWEVDMDGIYIDP